MTRPITSREQADRELRRLGWLLRKYGWPEIRSAIMRVERLRASLPKYLAFLSYLVAWWPRNAPKVDDSKHDRSIFGGNGPRTFKNAF